MSSSAQRGAVAPVRFGLVGYGFGARYFHAPLIASAPECKLVAVATRSAERRALVATEHPDAAVVDDLAGLVAAGAEAVTVSTPADTHIPLCRQALERGLPVVVDKPFALTAADARPAVELAERLGLALSVYQNRRWDSDFRTVRALADSGTLGEITRFESRFERRQDGPPAAGGGTLLDFGSHLVDQALQLLGPVHTVYAEIHHRDYLTGLDDAVPRAHPCPWRPLPPLRQLGAVRPRAPASASPAPAPPTSSTAWTSRRNSWWQAAPRRPRPGSWGTEPQDRVGSAARRIQNGVPPDRTRPLGHLLP